jgi:predicted GIY-YIG superfamily endonuclease
MRYDLASQPWKREDCHGVAQRSRALARNKNQMKYVYILQSMAFPDRYYVGSTDDLKSRLKYHNAGKAPHTSKYKPWRVNTYVGFSDEERAISFEKYLKSSSGRAFSKKRL